MILTKSITPTELIVSGVYPPQVSTVRWDDFSTVWGSIDTSWQSLLSYISSVDRGDFTQESVITPLLVKDRPGISVELGGTLFSFNPLIWGESNFVYGEQQLSEVFVLPTLSPYTLFIRV